ncbi:hypothetical protein [Flammeovirga sp. SJP92]|uniref:hypothetical protein n=1 Tax=Flammeovirga sp. SJP92 TaxID=1775430 RepID=UPI0007899ECF|nr:hypothetical protein [Flammeovirga sp. SJP92]
MKQLTFYIASLFLLISCHTNDDIIIKTHFSEIDFSFLSDTSKKLSSSKNIKEPSIAKNMNLGILSITANGNYTTTEPTFFNKTYPLDLNLKLSLHNVEHLPYEVISYHQENVSDTSYQVVKESKFYPSHLLCIQNLSQEEIGIKQQDNQVFLIQEAKNEDGEWKNIEYFDYSKCGNSYWITALPAHQMMLVQIPKYAGNFDTFLRVKLKVNNQLFYSDSIQCTIQKSQFDLSPQSSDYRRLRRKFTAPKVDSLIYFL